MKKDKYNGNGQWAIVTGASSGIGFELAKQFAEHGFDLLVAAEDSQIFEAAKVLSDYGVRVDSVQVDLSEETGVQRLYERIKQDGRSIDAIAINAGVGVGGASFDKTDLQSELSLIRLNVMSVVHLTKLILPDMIKSGYGRILFTSSVAAFMPGPFESVYSASKAFVQSFAEAIHAETKDKGITITALQPGATETNFFHRAGMDDTKVGSAKKADPADVAKDGFEALMEGRSSIISGFQNKIEANMARVVPQKLAAKMHESMTKPNGTKH